MCKVVNGVLSSDSTTKASAIYSALLWHKGGEKGA